MSSKKPKEWSASIVLESIQERHSNGLPITSWAVQKSDSCLYQAGCRYYSNWRGAIEASGIDYDSIRIQPADRKKFWDKDLIIKKIIIRLDKHQPLNSNYMQIHEHALYGAACKYFGSWKKAIEGAGLIYTDVRVYSYEKLTKHELILEVVRRNDQGKSIAYGVVNKEDSRLCHAAVRHFGARGWAKARMLAGFEPLAPDTRVVWTTETVCSEIKRLHGAGIKLHINALQDSPYRKVLGGGKSVFGSWEKAIHAAGLDYSTIRKNGQAGWWTKSRILICIKTLHRRGVSLNSKSIQHSNNSLFNAGRAQFGNWGNAVEAAGFDYKHNWTFRNRKNNIAPY